MSPEPMAPAGVFPTTHWSSIYLASAPEQQLGQSALASVLAKYRGPLLAHARWRFQANDHDAQDWFQGFVEKKILERELLKHAREQRGRFRTFLMNAFDNFVRDQIRHANRSVRSPARGFVPLDDLADAEPAAPPAGADPFDLEWARAVLDEAVRRVHGYYTVKKRMDLWSVFDQGLVQPILRETTPPSMTSLAESFGFASPEQASNALITAKRMFKQTLEQTVAEYVVQDEQAEAEVRDLVAILSGGG